MRTLSHIHILKVGDLIVSHSEFLPNRRSIACSRYNLLLWVVEMLANLTHFVLVSASSNEVELCSTRFLILRFFFYSLSCLIIFLAVSVSWSAVYSCCCCMMLFLKCSVTLREFLYSSSDISVSIWYVWYCVWYEHCNGLF